MLVSLESLPQRLTSFRFLNSLGNARSLLGFSNNKLGQLHLPRLLRPHLPTHPRRPLAGFVVLNHPFAGLMAPVSPIVFQSGVAGAPSSEQTFHIFYYLFADAATEERQHMQLLEKTTFPVSRSPRYPRCSSEHA
jgi:hypothetical protein